MNILRDGALRASGVRVMLSGIVVLLASACGSLQGNASKDAQSGASLLATAARTPGSNDCQLREPDVANTQDNTADDAVARLNTSFERVRKETFFGDFALSPPPRPDVLFNEAWRLVELAKAAKAKAAGTPVPADAATLGQADAVEALLLQRLPWAADMGSKPDPNGPTGDILINVVQNARNFIGMVANQQNGQPDPLNQLLPTQATKFLPLELRPVAPLRGGNTIVVKSFFQRSDPQTRGPFEKLTDLASFRAFHVLALLSAAHVHELLTNPSLDPEHKPGKLDAEVRVFNVARFLSAYFDAYFRGGQFLQVTIDDDAIETSLSNKLAGALKGTGVTAAQIKTGLKGAAGRVCSGDTADSALCGGLKLGSTAFVTRAGLSVQFSGVSFALGNGVSHTYPQVAQFGSQMIRVFVEALFDANGQHAPAMPNSTACTEGLFTGEDECVKANQAPDTRLTQIDMLASAAEALSQTATGALIRAGGMAALNNEVVAQMLETLAAVNARKITERVLFIATNGQTSGGGQCALPAVSLTVKQGKDTPGESAAPPAVTQPGGVAAN